MQLSISARGLLSITALLALLAGGCDSRAGGGSRCTFQSSSSSGGICRIDLSCSGAHVTASCTDVDCVCLRDDTPTGARFAADGFCDASMDEQSRRTEASCGAASADAGTGGAFADYCADNPVQPGFTCTGSAEGDRCPANVYCDSCAREVPTSCVCTASAAGYSFACADPCAACADADAGAPMPDGGSAGTACLAGPQCLESTTGSVDSVGLVADVCRDVGGTFVTRCETAGHDRCVVASAEIAFYTDRSDPDYVEADSRAACDDLGGTFTP